MRLLSLLLCLITPFAFAEDLATSQPLNFYITPGGSDVNSCLAPNRACGTLSGVATKVPKRLRHVVTVFVAPGTYPSSLGSVLDGYTCEAIPGSPGQPGSSHSSNTSLSGQLVIKGVQTTVTSGTATSGTAPTGGAPGFLTNTSILLPDAGPGPSSWTVDAFKGMFLEVAGVRRVILSNTASVITYGGTTIGTITGGTSTYKVLTPGSIFQLSSPLLITNVVSRQVPLINNAPFNYTPSAANNGAACLVLQDLQVNNIATAQADAIALNVDGVNGLTITNSRFLTAPGTGSAVALKLVNVQGAAVGSYFEALGNSSCAASFFDQIAWHPFPNSYYRGAVGGLCLLSHGLITGGGNYETTSAGGSAVFATQFTNMEMLAVGATFTCSNPYDTSGTGIGIAEQAQFRIRGNNSSTGVNQFTNCWTALKLVGPTAFAGYTNGTFKTTGVTSVIDASFGAQVHLSAGLLGLPVTFSIGTSADGGTATHITVDGVSYTTTQMDALSPQVVTGIVQTLIGADGGTMTAPNPYGTWVGR